MACAARADAHATADALLRLQEGDPAPKLAPVSSTSSAPKSDNTGLGIGLYAVLLAGGLAAYVAFQYMAKQQEVPTAA